MALPAALAATMLTAVGCCLALVGATGAALGSWQLVGWLLAGGVPVVAEVWRHSGLTGELFVAFFDWLPLVLGIGVVFHVLVALLGAGLVLRRGWARRGTLLLVALWMSVASAAWLLVRLALEDLARTDPTRAGFAQVSEFLSTEVTLLSLAVGVALVYLLLQPTVRSQFRPGS